MLRHSVSAFLEQKISNNINIRRGLSEIAFLNFQYILKALQSKEQEITTLLIAVTNHTV